GRRGGGLREGLRRRAREADLREQPQPGKEAPLTLGQRRPGAVEGAVERALWVRAEGDGVDASRGQLCAQRRQLGSLASSVSRQQLDRQRQPTHGCHERRNLCDLRWAWPNLPGV